MHIGRSFGRISDSGGNFDNLIGKQFIGTVPCPTRITRHPKINKVLTIT